MQPTCENGFCMADVVHRLCALESSSLHVHVYYHRSGNLCVVKLSYENFHVEKIS